MVGKLHLHYSKKNVSCCDVFVGSKIHVDDTKNNQTY